MQNRIELLDLNLLDDAPKLKEIDHWARVMNWPNGWHYDLDIVWILKQIENLGLQPGATILDAGAGLGLTQFILAARGFNVISMDFTQRQRPRLAEGIFDIEIRDRDLGEFRHEYMEWMNYGAAQEGSGSVATSASLAKKICRPAKVFPLLLNPGKARYMIKQRLGKKFNRYYDSECRKDHSGFGKITFLRGTFNAIPLDEKSVDALVSVSAFEHNTFSEMPSSVGEFSRVLKEGAFMIITTSAARDRDWYFEPAKAWNFTGETLSTWFSVKDNISYDYDPVMERLRHSQKLLSRIPEFYRYNGDNGLPFAKLDEAQYLPVGILREKLPQELA